MKDRILEKLKEIIETNTGAKATNIDNPKSLRMDSLDMVEFVISIEREYDITIPDSDTFKFQDMTVEEIADHLVKIV